MWQLVTIAALLALMLGLGGLTREVSRIDTALDPKSLATTGFVILAAFTCGELGRRLRLPALVGYLVAGIAFGPSLAEVLGFGSFAEVFTRRVIDDLKLVNILAVGVVGTMGGCEIHFSELRRSWRTILLIFGLIALTVLPATAGLVLGLHQFAGALVPFFVDVPLPQVIGGAVLIGVMAMGMSPAATIALIQELGAKGPFSSLALGIVVVADLLLVAMFLVALALTKLTLLPEGISAAGVLDALPHIAAEFGWAFVLGLGTGLLFILYLRFVKREVLLFALGLIFAATYAAQVLHAETLLVFLTAGFIVQNLSRHGHALLHAFEQIALPVFVVYFTTQAAGLDLQAMTAYLPLALALVATRVFTLTASVRVGTRLAGASDRIQRDLWLCFFSQGGVDLVLAGMVAAAVPGWGADVQVLVTSTVMIYLFLGPPLFKLAIERVGESTSARERGLENLSQESSSDSGAAPVDRIPEPAVADPRLRARLIDLQGAALALDAELVRGRLDPRARALADTLRAVDEASAALVATWQEEDPDPAALPAARDAFTRRVAALAPAWEEDEPGLATAADLHALLQGLEGAERFTVTFEVTREDHLFELTGTERPLLRLVRRARRLRRRLFGPGARTIPLGRLWRYHVAMGVPIELWRHAEAGAAEFWEHLAAHLRELDDLAAALADGDPEARARARDEAARSATRLAELGLLRERLEDDLRDRVSRTLAAAFGNLLRAVDLAGTIELPAYRYRLSRRFDAALAAKAEVLARRERSALLARGARDHLIAWASARAFATTTREQANELGAALRERLLAPAFAGLRALRAAAAAEGEVSERLGHALGPALTDASTALARSEALIGDGQHARAVAARLADALASVPRELAPIAPGSRQPRPVRVNLRLWLHLEVEVEASLLVGEASERLAAALRQEMVELDRLAAIADYYRRAAAPRPGREGALDDELRQGVERLTREIDALVVAQEESVADVTQELERALARRADDAIEPVVQGRYGALQRRLAERVQAGPGRQRLRGLRRLGERLAARVRRLRPVGAEALAELDHYDRLLAAAASIDQRIPLLYRRLFGPAPDAVELLVDRPGPATALRIALARWQDGLSTCVLVRGDRGAGKRTIVRRTLGGELGGEVVWLRLTSALDDEREVAAALGDLVGLGPQGTFDEVALRLAEGPRRIVVVENGERLFKRAPGGHREAERFLLAMRRAAPRTMWVVLISEAGATLLESLIGLGEHFDATIDVGPMSADEIAAMILARHRLSGHALDLAGARRGALERLVPALAARGRRDHAVLRQLHALSGGNPRQALTFWLAAATPQGDGGRIVIGPLPRVRGSILAGLVVTEHLLLAALVQHGPLRPAQLAEVSGRPLAALEAELVRLRGRGILASSASDPQALVISPHLVHPLTLELRQRGVV